MIYTEYAKAAERHLETCTHLVHVLEEQYQKKEVGSTLSNRELKEKLELLSNLYYLSGYIIECVYSYALCQYIGMNLTDDVKTQLPQRGVCWSYNSLTRNNNTHAIYRQMHKMSGSNDLSYFTTHNVSGISAIPILGGSQNMSSPNAQILFDNWSAEVRYSISNQLDYANVFDFFRECEKIYRLTRQNITFDYV